MRWRLSGVVLATIVAATAATPAWCEDAESLVKAGVELRRAGKDAEALELFRKAWDLSKAPRARGQMGLAEQALNLWVDAETHVGEALAAKDDRWVQQNHAVLVDAMQVIGRHLAWVVVETNAPRAEIAINGRPFTPPRTRAVAGDVVVEVHAPGYSAVSRTIRVMPETEVKEVVTLEPLPAPPALRPKEPVVVVRPPSSAQKTVGFVASAVGLVAIGVGSYFGVRAMSLKDDRDRECVGGCTQAGVDADRDGRSAATISTVAIIGGVVFLAAGIVAVLTAPSRSANVSSAPLRWSF